MRRSRLLSLVLPLVALLLLPACTSGGEPSGRTSALVERVRDAVEQARERAERAVVVTEPTRAPQGTVLRTDTQTAFDYAEYSATLSAVLASLEEYWSQVLPRLGAPYSDPARYVSYRGGEGGPSCGGERAPARNAFYCPPGDFLAWDESGLLIPYYVSNGDFAAAFVLAHEFGHAMQVRLPRQERLGVLRELQADCYAGAWARYAADSGYVDPGDLDEATLAVFAARDVPGTPFTDPRAHGTGFERTRAFTDGYDDGPTACYPAPAQDWLVSRGTG